MDEENKPQEMPEQGSEAPKQEHPKPHHAPKAQPAHTQRKKPARKAEKKPEQKEEELSINLSGFTKFFKGSKKEKREEHKTEEKRSEDLSFDIGMLKDMFKKGPRKESKGNDEEDVSFDLKNPLNFIKKNYMLFLIAIPLILSIFVRMQAMDLSIADQWAVNSVIGYYKGQMKGQIDQQYPNLPDQNKNALVDKQFSDFTKSNKAQIDAQVAQTSAFFKSYFQYESNGKQYNYMPDIDPYFWLRYARNYAETGMMGDEIKNGIEWDNHMFAPLGTRAQTTVHNRMIAWTYDIMKIFNSKIPIMQAAGYLPVILMALATIPAFFIGRKVGGNIGGFFTAALVAIHPAIMGRTLWGHADTDVYNIFFPMLIAWLFLESFDAKTMKNRLILSALTGFSVAAYALFWEWWYVFYFTMGAAGIYLLYVLMINRDELKKGFAHFIKTEHVKSTLLTIAAYFIFAAIFISLFLGFSGFVNGALGPFYFISIKAATSSTLWPNVYTTVAELNASSFNDIVGSVGGKLLFYLSIVGIFLSFKKKDLFGKSDIKYPLLMALWFIGTIYASFKGVRFVLLLAPIFSLALGAAFGIGYNYITTWFSKSFEVNRKITGTILVVVMLGLVGLVPLPFASGCPFFPQNSMTCSAYNTARSDVPIVNDVWYNALTKIKDNSKKDAIITSWWDFGHHFKFIADRPVTFDGGSQNSPQAHWVGKLLLTDDEKTSIGILRMLDCGANNAFDEIDKKFNDISTSVNLINKIIVQDKEAARQTLKDSKFTNPETENILKYTHCDPPEAFLITSDDMIGKAGVWSHFGSWDFMRADVWQNARNMPRQEAIDYLLAKKHYGLTKEKAEQLYDEARSIFNDREANSWIAPWPGYAAGPEPCEIFGNETLRCQSGTSINFTNSEAIVPTQQGIGHPVSVVFPKTNGDINEIKYSDSIVPYSMVIVPTSNGLTEMLTSPELAKSMFTRLFFMKGQGLSCYKPFSDEKGLTGTSVSVWKVDWSCSTKNIVVFNMTGPQGS